MYKTAIISDEASQDLRRAASLAREFGLDALEIRSVGEKNPFQMTPADFREIRRIADDFGLRICAVASPLFKSPLGDAAETKRQTEALRRVAEGAHILGTGLIRSFTFWREPHRDLRRVADAYETVLPLVEREELVLAVESEPSVNTANIAELCDFLRTLNHPRVGALYDPGNEICWPSAPAPYPEGYEQLAKWIRHIHVKDIHWAGDHYEPACLGEGDVDFPGLFARLRRDGYGGYLSVETHWRMRGTLDSALMRTPQGSGFSDGGMEATRRYLEILRERGILRGGGAQ